MGEKDCVTCVPVGLLPLPDWCPSSRSWLWPILRAHTGVTVTSAGRAVGGTGWLADRCWLADKLLAGQWWSWLVNWLYAGGSCLLADWVALKAAVWVAVVHVLCPVLYDRIKTPAVLQTQWPCIFLSFFFFVFFVCVSEVLQSSSDQSKNGRMTENGCK